MGIVDQEFYDFIQRLDPGCTDSKKGYELLRLKLIKFFAWRRHEDPESLADETIARLVKSIIANQEIQSEWAFVYGVAKNVVKEQLRERDKRERLNESIEELAGRRPEVENNDCLSQSLDHLDPEKREILKKYYGDEHRDILAKSMGITLNALRLQVFRIKKELRDSYEQCMKKKSES